MVHHDTDAAVADLTHQLGPDRRFEYSSIYSIRGSVVAFACGLFKPAWASAAVTTKVLAQLTTRCGPYVSGNGFPRGTEAEGNKNAAMIGYMTYHKGLHFCEKALRPHDDKPIVCLVEDTKK
ncbi:hypothetical protein JDV02_009578 [Purpureocillium takamizusanense]|uniref:Uncharacterized protein n=1 Tax=Purpureocillium takamizusanense TaxID=2060973 RepID=A0A9Q8VFM6_9HYPO|nr:uncharacterized protein JDV02_009578 [Purpureocillium takamizusanense]UNI23778.1 hypothetical protein JDV02_009578 [Purpureocillium takamizusanense]